MDIVGEEIRDRLRSLNEGIRIPPPAVWLPFIAATHGGDVIAEIGERSDVGKDESRVVYTALLPKRIVRVVASGTGEWEDPQSGRPDEVSVQSVSIEGATVTFENTTSERSELGGRFTLLTNVRLSVGGEVVSVPYFPISEHRDDVARIDAFTHAVLAELNRAARA